MPTQSGEAKQVLVIDGQQRLTTLSILLQALPNSFEESMRQKCKEGTTFKGCLYHTKNHVTGEMTIKIEHSRIDRKYYQQVINDQISADEIDYENCRSNILKCYKYFSDRLQEIELQVRQDLFNYLLSENNKIFVVIDLTDRDDEQSIFDTINSSGVRLGSGDIIKNVLFQRAFDLGYSQDVLNIWPLAVSNEQGEGQLF